MCIQWIKRKKPASILCLCIRGLSGRGPAVFKIFFDVIIQISFSLACLLKGFEQHCTKHLLLIIILWNLRCTTLKSKNCLRGTVARDFLVSVFFMDLRYIYGPQISRLKGFSFLFRFREAMYSNTLMNPCCRLLRGLKISTVACCSFVIPDVAYSVYVQYNFRV
jgi:hypothetical protein